MPPRVVTRQDANAIGWTNDAVKHALAINWWSRLQPRVYFTRGAEPRESDRWLGAVRYAGLGAVLSGASALRALAFRDVPVPSRMLVLVPPHRAVVGTVDVVIRRTSYLGHPVYHEQVPLAPVARAVLDHALTLRRLADVDAVLTEAIRRNLCRLTDLETAASMLPRRGAKLVRQAVSEVGDSWSPAESALARRLRRERIRGWRQNVEVRGRAGLLVGIADFWFDDLGAALEVHGARDHSSKSGWEKTLRRSARFVTAGTPLLQVSAGDVFNRPDEVIANVRSWLAGLQSR